MTRKLKMEPSKLQAPSSKLQKNPKFQIPLFKTFNRRWTQMDADFLRPLPHLSRFSFWCLGFGAFWSLQLGAWNLELPVRQRRGRHGCFCSKRINRAAGRPTRRSIFSPKHGLWSGPLRPTNLSNSVPPRGRWLGMNPIHSFGKNNSNDLQAGHALTVLPVLKSAHEA
jgi:hypothetical protein